MILLVAVVAGGGIGLMKTLKESMPDEALLAREHCSIAFRGSVHDRAIALRDVVLIERDAALISVVQEIKHLTEAYAEAEEELAVAIAEAGDITPEEQALLDTIGQTNVEAQPVIAQVIEFRRSGRADEARELLASEAGPLLARWLGEINAHIDWAKAVHKDEAYAAAATGKTLQTGMLGLTAFCLVFAAAAAFVVIQAISGPIRRVAGQQRDIASGRLDLPPIDSKAAGDLGDLARATDAMAQTLREIISGVAGTSQQVADQVGSIHDSTAEISDNAGKQANELDQIAAAATEMSASLVEVEDKTRSSNEEAQRSGEFAAAGREAVSEVINNIRSIDESVNVASLTVNDLGTRSKEIGEIITVINDIADQTNLLALNAAIEAARAGEHGRGFAVVADEVRKLAERTTTATNEIATSIGKIQEQIEGAILNMTEGAERVRTGVQSAETADEKLQAIFESTEAVANMISSVAMAAAEQSHAASTVSESVERVNQLGMMTSRQTNGTVESVATLKNRSDELKILVDRFQL